LFIGNLTTTRREVMDKKSSLLSKREREDRAVGGAYFGVQGKGAQMHDDYPDPVEQLDALTQEEIVTARLVASPDRDPCQLAISQEVRADHEVIRAMRNMRKVANS
jgi:hypothetical protein